MEFRRLTSTDLRSLLALYKQLDTDNQCSAEQSESVWKEIEAKHVYEKAGFRSENKMVDGEEPWPADEGAVPLPRSILKQLRKDGENVRML